MTNKGVIIRFHAEDVSQTGRGALGVRMMRLDQDAIVSSLAIVDREEETTEEVTEATAETAATETPTASLSDEAIKGNMKDFAQQLVDEENE